MRDFVGTTSEGVYIAERLWPGIFTPSRLGRGSDGPAASALVSDPSSTRAEGMSPRPADSAPTSPTTPLLDDVPGLSRDVEADPPAPSLSPVTPRRPAALEHKIRIASGGGGGVGLVDEIDGEDDVAGAKVERAPKTRVPFVLGPAPDGSRSRSMLIRRSIRGSRNEEELQKKVQELAMT